MPGTILQTLSRALLLGFSFLQSTLTPYRFSVLKFSIAASRSSSVVSLS